MDGTTWLGWTPNTDEAHYRALELLKSWLTPSQLEQYENSRNFDVIGSLGNMYRIHSTMAYGIHRLEEDGTTAFRLCVVPDEVTTLGDTMLAQKIALETDEMGTLWIANHAAPLSGSWYS
jgi:hypothetical protein